MAEDYRRARVEPELGTPRRLAELTIATAVRRFASTGLLEERVAHFDALGAGFDARERRELVEMRRAFVAQFPPDRGAEILLFRIVRKRGSRVRAQRRGLDEILSIV